MKEYSLNGIWRLSGNGYDCEGKIPGSLYSILLENGLMEDPFYRNNELEAFELCEHEYTFSRSFDWNKGKNPIFLCCDGLDTLCDVYLNGKHVAYTDNMHRGYRFDVTNLLQNGENTISILFHPVNEYVKKKNAEEKLKGVGECLKGFGHLRKAHCMMGWDWGARLPDAGIWKNIYLLEKDSAEITEFRILQRHEKGKVFLTPIVKTDVSSDVRVTLTDPDGNAMEIPVNEETEIQNPKLWWVNGLGGQPLYTVTAEVIEKERAVHSQTKRVGLRTLRLVRERDKYGESYYHEINGVPFFAMGADYIPEDNVLSRITYERTKTLLTHCKDANFNVIRVWGGGYYPHDDFFDICDELGLVVYLDFMFACSFYPTNDAFWENVKQELRENIMRVRHHACIGLLCGNNEEESCFPFLYNETVEKYPFKGKFIEIFEDVVPDLIKELCPEISYVPSSPDTAGHFIDPDNEDYGDSHYWAVWHHGKPFTDYRNHYFRYLSEFGFQSFPCEKTINAVTCEEDRNVFSRVMERHQRNGTANGKILSYLSQTYLYPTEFSTLLYASQLLQAESIRYGVEHFRRNRGRCMGTLYWQLNDIWPVASWASIDYYGRLKALHYVAKRFYAPVMISCRETGEMTGRITINDEPYLHDYQTKAQLAVNNDTLQEVQGTARWALRNSDGSVIKQDEREICVAPMSVYTFDEMDFRKVDVDNVYLSFAFVVDGKTVSEGTVLFTVPKYFRYKNPNLRYKIEGDEITVYADAYASYVEIDSPDSDFVLSDNYFDMNAGSKTVKILSGTPKTVKLRSVYDIGK